MLRPKESDECLRATATWSLLLVRNKNQLTREHPLTVEQPYLPSIDISVPGSSDLMLLKTTKGGRSIEPPCHEAAALPEQARTCADPEGLAPPALICS